MKDPEGCKGPLSFFDRPTLDLQTMQPKTSSVHSRALAVAALSTGFSLISSAFGFYYVKIFLNIYNIQEQWFQVAQTLFLIWNAVNDPLFAYCQDSTNFKCTRTRRESVLYAAPLFAVSFLVPWFPWAGDNSAAWVTGLHLIVALCFWDTMFTYVGLAYCCLSTELSIENEDRLTLVKYQQVGSILGSSSVFMLQYFSDQLDNFRAFQAGCVVIAIISCLLMRYCGKHAHTQQDLQNTADGECRSNKSQDYSYIMLTKQILFNRDFLGFVVMNFFQEFHRTFLANFLAIFCDELIAKEVIPKIVRSVFYGGIGTLSKVMTIVGTPLISRYGYFNVIRASFIIKIVSGLLYYTVGPVNHWVLILFLLIDSVAADSTFAMFNLPLSDIADSDTVRYNRRHRATSMIYGTNALVVKPAISLSPMLVVAILNRHGYEKLKNGSLDLAGQTKLHDVMFTLICLYPLIIGCIQLLSWSFYTIRHKKNVDMTLLVTGEAEVDRNESV